MDKLITISLNGERIAVHPDCLGAHLRLGWRQVHDDDDDKVAPQASRRRARPADTVSESGGASATADGNQAEA